MPKALPSAMTQWVAAIRGGDPAVFDLDAARDLSEVMEAAAISAREGTPVGLPIG